MIGLPLFIGMRAAGQQVSGQIYNADDGKSYASQHSGGRPGFAEGSRLVGPLCGGETGRGRPLKSRRVASAPSPPTHSAPARVIKCNVIAAYAEGVKAAHHRGHPAGAGP